MRVFIGYDPAESVAFHVAASSLMRRGLHSVTALRLDQLPCKRTGTTEFTYTRFLVPWLCDFKGVALYVDCDVLFRADLDLEISDRHAVSVVKHDYVPKDAVKFLGKEQVPYERKNWSSVMLFNNPLCPVLTPEYVNRASGLELHQFKWLRDHQIGELGPEWNHLVGEYPENPEAKIAHFTLGTPCFPEYQDCEFSDEWCQERSQMLSFGNDLEVDCPCKDDGVCGGTGKVIFAGVGVGSQAPS